MLTEAMMTPKQVSLVQETWGRVAPIQEQAATIFYQKLFAADPALKSLFKSNLDEQKRKLTKMIGVAVNALDRLETIVPAVRSLGQRHGTYGVKASDYSTVGAALLATLEQGLGAAFTPDVKDAWATAYSILARTMQDAAETAAA
jgi:nitric oxide dioxygenase